MLKVWLYTLLINLDKHFLTERVVKQRKYFTYNNKYIIFTKLYETCNLKNRNFSVCKAFKV